MKCPYNIKVCTKCKRILIAWENNFRRKKRGKYGLNSVCKQCEHQYNKQWKNKHKKEMSDYMKEYNKQYREEHKEELKEKKKQYNEENKKHFSDYHKRYREKHKEKLKSYYKQYREEHKEELKEKKKQYNEENPHIRFNSYNKRRELEENQGNGITKEQWLEMMLWFDFKCAYSDKYIGGDSEFRTIDHIIPLSKGGLNEIWNCVPMYRNYNSSKHSNNMEDWYTKQDFYSEERLIKIYVWIEYAYEKWGDVNG